jgi:hypothetical protein
MTRRLPAPDPQSPGDPHGGVSSPVPGDPGPHPPHDDPQDSSGQSAHGRRHGGNRIPSIEEICANLLKLNGMVLMGLISTRVAAVIQRTYKSILDLQTGRAQQQPEGVPQEGLAEMYHKDPKYISLLEPFLADGQIDWLMEQIRGNQDDQA